MIYFQICFRSPPLFSIANRIFVASYDKLHDLILKAYSSIWHFFLTVFYFFFSSYYAPIVFLLDKDVWTLVVIFLLPLTTPVVIFPLPLTTLVELLFFFTACTTILKNKNRKKLDFILTLTQGNPLDLIVY